jgi:hypothetical protein
MVNMIVCPCDKPLTVQLKNPSGNDTPDGFPDEGSVLSDTAVNAVISPELVLNCIGTPSRVHGRKLIGKPVGKVP